MDKKIQDEILKKFKPKVLNVIELRKERVILTDTYSWRDFREAISLTEQLTTQKVLEIIDKWYNDDKTCSGRPHCTIKECDLCVNCFDDLKHQIQGCMDLKQETSNHELSQEKKASEMSK